MNIQAFKSINPIGEENFYLSATIAAVGLTLISGKVLPIKQLTFDPKTIALAATTTFLGSVAAREAKGYYDTRGSDGKSEQKRNTEHRNTAILATVLAGAFFGMQAISQVQSYLPDVCKVEINKDFGYAKGAMVVAVLIFKGGPAALEYAISFWNKKPEIQDQIT